MKKISFFVILQLLVSIGFSQDHSRRPLDFRNEDVNVQEAFRSYEEWLNLSQLSTDLKEKETKHLGRLKYFWEARFGKGDNGMPSSQPLLRASRKLFDNHTSFGSGTSKSQTTVCIGDFPQSGWSPLGPMVLPQAGASSTATGMGIIQSLAVPPSNLSHDIVYAGTNKSGLWRTMNINSATPVWECITESLRLPGLGISDIAISASDPNLIFIATGLSHSGVSYGVGLLKSTDGGDSWTATGLSYSANQQVLTQEVEIHPTNPQVIFA